jgi:L-fuconolactonase
MDSPYRKRLAGQDEPILDPDLPIIDSHHHLFDRPDTRYLIEEYAADAALGHNVRASVYVETLAMVRRSGPELLRPLGEVEFANGMAAMSASGAYGAVRIAAAIVGYADLRYGERVGELLDKCLEVAPNRYRGVRQLVMEHPDPSVWRYVSNPPPAGLLRHPEFLRGFGQLAPRGLTFDAAVFSHQLRDLARLAADHPETTIVLNHLGQVLRLERSPEERDEAVADWRAGIAELATQPNVMCKVGGLGLPFWGFGLEMLDRAPGYEELATHWGPYVEHVIEEFGADRCMMESNFPVDGRCAGFVPTWNALKHIVRSASGDEKRALFHDTAARVYRIEVPAE